jgi:3-oxoacyl-[acyl-carrier protein] reductase
VQGRASDAASAEAFGALGARIIGAEIDPQRAATATQTALRSAGIEAEIHVCDVRDTRTASSALVCRHSAPAVSGLDTLVNNVGDSIGEFMHPFDRAPEATVGRTLRNQSAPCVHGRRRPRCRCCAGVRPGATIINVSSIEAFRAIPMCPVYSAFKHAITGFTRSLALVLGPEGIRVNTIAPETTETEQVKPSQYVTPERQREYRALDAAGTFRRAPRHGRLRGVPGERAVELGHRHDGERRWRRTGRRRLLPHALGRPLDQYADRDRRRFRFQLIRHHIQSYTRIQLHQKEDTTMLQVNIHGPGDDVRLDPVREPATGANDIIVRTGACGICGSDHVLHRHGRHAAIATGWHDGLGTRIFAGTVETVGHAVQRISCPVRSVVVDPMADFNIGNGGPEGAFTPLLLVRNARLGVNVHEVPPRHAVRACRTGGAARSRHACSQ